MKSEHYKKVEKFMQLAGQDTPGKLVELDPETRVLRAKLILEEALETIEKGLGVSINYDSYGGTFSPEFEINLELFKQLEFKANKKYDPINIIDGCCDIKVVTTGTLVALGVPDEPFQNEVDKNNLDKFGPGGYRRDDGKWVKPPGHKAPDIEKILTECE